MARSLEFFFDYGSPYSYLADTQLPALRARSGCEIVYRPMRIVLVRDEALRIHGAPRPPTPASTARTASWPRKRT